MPPFPPPPPDELLGLPFAVPGGWWAIAGLAAAGALLVAGVLGWRTRRRYANDPDPPRAVLLDRRAANTHPGGAAGGRHPCPPGLPPGEEARLRRVRAVADFLDNSLRVPGIGFPIGWDSVIGLVPGVGDAVTGALACWIILQARRLGVPKRTLVRMLANAGVDLAGGTLPLVGDAFDVVFKANRKNLRLIEAHLADPPRGRKALRG